MKQLFLNGTFENSNFHDQFFAEDSMIKKSFFKRSKEQKFQWTKGGKEKGLKVDKRSN